MFCNNLLKYFVLINVDHSNIYSNTCMYLQVIHSVHVIFKKVNTEIEMSQKVQIKHELV